MTEPASRRPAGASSRVQSLPLQPPHSIEAEQSLLGGLLLDNRVFFELADKVFEEDFYRADHRLIWKGICELLQNSKACDFVTLSEHLRHQGKLEEAGGVSYLGSLAVDTHSVANIKAYAGIVHERALLRGLIAAGADIGDLGFHPEGRAPAELVDEAEKKVFAIRERGARGQSTYRPIGTVMQEVEKLIEIRQKDPKALAGLSTGFTELDRRTQGMHPGDLIIVAARPGMGKTTLAMNIAEHVAFLEKKAVAVFSMEMSGEQLTQRIISSFGRIELGKLRSGNLDVADMDRLASAGNFLREAPLFIDETGALSPLDLKARARRMAAQHDIKLIVVDYIQLMQVPGTRENRTNEVSEITRSLKSLAKELKIPVVALSQLSRANEKEARKPKLSDLRDSGGIEQDADMVLFIYREETPKEEVEDRTKAEIIIGKQRSGPTGSFDLLFLGQYTKFDNPADSSYGGDAF